MLVHNEYGNMNDPHVSEVVRDCEKKLSDLMVELLSKGMSVVEGRALIAHILSCIDGAMLVNILSHQVSMRIQERGHNGTVS